MLVDAQPATAFVTSSSVHRRFEDDVAVRHVEKLPLAGSLARVAPDGLRRATTEGVAVRPAGAALADQRNARLVVAEEGLTPGEGPLEHVLDLVVRGFEPRVVRVGDGDVVPVRGGRRARARIDVLDVLVAVAEVGVEAPRARAPGLARVDREYGALALARVRQQEVLDRRARATVWPLGRRSGGRPAPCRSAAGGCPARALPP